MTNSLGRGISETIMQHIQTGVGHGHGKPPGLSPALTPLRNAAARASNSASWSRSTNRINKHDLGTIQLNEKNTMIHVYWEKSQGKIHVKDLHRRLLPAQFSCLYSPFGDIPSTWMVVVTKNFVMIPMGLLVGAKYR